MSETFKALILSQVDGKTQVNIEQLSHEDLPSGDVLIAVDYSCMNYKDAMAVTGTGKIVRQWPMVPGVDFVGRVLESSSADYQAGDAVLLTGWGVGERYWGGYSQRQCVNSEFLVPLPKGLSPQRAMMAGTAGLTAMLCVLALEQHDITPQSGPVIVTGAAGGVGSFAVALLANLGYQVAAMVSPRQAARHDYLRQLGASEIICGDEWSKAPRPLEAQRWMGAIDTVGSQVLARVLAEMEYNGCVAACGLAGGFDLPTTVMPFILRGVTLQGVDSVMIPKARRIEAWERLVKDMPEQAFDEIAQFISLEQVPEMAAALMAGGKLKGRCVVDLNA